MIADASRVRWTVIAALAVGSGLATNSAIAMPGFARQTGLECTACHFSWPELTAVGRQFKLGGYTLMKPNIKGDRPLVSFSYDDNPPLLPLAGFVQASATRTSNTGGDSTDFPHQNQLMLQQASLFWTGRIADHLGAFAQWSYDGVEHHSAIDNFDLRLADRRRLGGIDVMYGLSLNNSPGVTDIYQTMPVWAFPFSGSSVAAGPIASTMMEEGLAQQVAGLNLYSLWNKTVYAEIGGYRTADGVLSFLRAGTNKADDKVLDGIAPYWRLALQHDWGEGSHSAMLGAYGMTAKIYPDSLNPVGPTDKFRDLGLDAQYQYVTDVHRVSAQVNYIHEKQDLDATFAAGDSANPHNTLNSFNAKLSYYYNNKYGITFNHFRIKGDSDSGLYPNDPVTGSASGSPDTSGYRVELNWLPWRDRRFTLQYTTYQKFNGAKDNYDGAGRNAKDNNSLYLLAWFPF